MTIAPPPLLIRHALVFDGTHDELADADIRIEGGTIVDIATGLAECDEMETLDAAGDVVIPGLIDAHFLAYGSQQNIADCEAVPTTLAALLAAQRLRRALEHGFTTVRDVAGGTKELAEAIRRGVAPGPEYLYSGPALVQADRPSTATAPHVCAVKLTEEVGGVLHLRQAVRDRLRGGAHAIKILGCADMETDGHRYGAQELAAVCAEAQAGGSYVSAGAYSAQSIGQALGAGVRSIDHGVMLTAHVARQMAQSGTFLVPTLASYRHMNGDPRAADGLAQAAAALAEAESAGVQVGFGTDLRGDLNQVQLQGLRLHAEVVGVYRALRAATSVNAALIGRADRGRLVQGHRADLVILNGNPFDNPAVLDDRQRIVIQAGRIVYC